jgi:hypothetical protein
MTNNIYPPDHLLRKWESLIIDEEQNVDVVLYEAFQAGADQELEACCEWADATGWCGAGDMLRDARRSKPSSLKEQAQAELDRLIALIPTEGAIAMAEPIRRALEALPYD